MLRRIGLVLLILLALVGAIALLATGGLIFAASRFAADGPPPKPIPDKAIAVLDLSRPLADGPADPFDGLFGGATLRLRPTVGAVDAAAKDKRAVALYLHVGPVPLPIALAQELRDALGRFRAAGKPCVAFAESFGELGTGSGTGYYLASACDEVWMQPSGGISLAGIAIEQPYLKQALGDVGVRFDASRRKGFKSALDNLTEEKMTPENRVQLEAVAKSWTTQLVAGVAAGRKLEPAAVRAVMDTGVLEGAEALDSKFVDHLGYRDEVMAALKERFGADAKHVRLAVFARHGRRDDDRKAQRVAVIHAAGPILPGRGGNDPFGSDSVIAGETLARHIRTAAEDKAIDAIILRIDSPGGAYTASDTVRREVEMARKSGKKVVASMGAVAASGGYFIAMDADRIVAQPGTITGSIGVLAGKPVLDKLWNDLDVRWELVQDGRHAAMWSPHRPFAPSERALLERSLDRIYADFVGKAAKGRGMSSEALEPLAQGRVWTGADAREKGLVDALGGFDVAVKEMRVLLALSEDARLTLVDWPKRRSPFETLSERFFDGDEPLAADTPAADGVFAALGSLLGRRPTSVEAAALAAFAELLGPALAALPPLAQPGERALSAPSLPPAPR